MGIGHYNKNKNYIKELKYISDTARFYNNQSFDSLSTYKQVYVYPQNYFKKFLISHTKKRNTTVKFDDNKNHKYFGTEIRKNPEISKLKSINDKLIERNIALDTEKEDFLLHSPDPDYIKNISIDNKNYDIFLSNKSSLKEKIQKQTEKDEKFLRFTPFTKTDNKEPNNGKFHQILSIKEVSKSVDNLNQSISGHREVHYYENPKINDGLIMPISQDKSLKQIPHNTDERHVSFKKTISEKKKRDFKCRYVFDESENKTRCVPENSISLFRANTNPKIQLINSRDFSTLDSREGRSAQIYNGSNYVWTPLPSAPKVSFIIINFESQQFMNNKCILQIQ